MASKKIHKRIPKSRQKAGKGKKITVVKHHATVKAKPAARKPAPSQKTKQEISHRPIVPKDSFINSKKFAYYWFLVGITFMILGISADQPALFTVGIVFFALGVAKKQNWPKRKKIFSFKNP